jgi:hypothetical protein
MDYKDLLKDTLAQLFVDLTYQPELQGKVAKALDYLFYLENKENKE